ncbi:unnamed protein product [Adineta steineri]|uniref:Uncharacterized protein n=1 Tax=Adineta steineri TaxID=433720 RepID=A0A813Y8B6_9BILA|nr:unnamed protein product [Adineta steineri]
MCIMPILRTFSWMCMIQPNSNALAQLTAVRGLAIGGGGLTFDWYEITKYLGSPLILPGWALGNIAIGFVLIVWIIVPIVYGTNVRDLRSNAIGGVVSADFTTISLVTAFTSFACVSAVFVHTILFYGAKIWNLIRSRANTNMGNDMHNRLMSLYPQVPDWWYLELFAPALVIACVVCDHSGWLNCNDSSKCTGQVSYTFFKLGTSPIDPQNQPIFSGLVANLTCSMMNGRNYVWPTIN